MVDIYLPSLEGEHVTHPFNFMPHAHQDGLVKLTPHSQTTDTTKKSLYNIQFLTKSHFCI